MNIYTLQSFILILGYIIDNIVLNINLKIQQIKYFKSKKMFQFLKVLIYELFSIFHIDKHKVDLIYL